MSLLYLLPMLLLYTVPRPGSIRFPILPFSGEFVGIYGAGRETRPLQYRFELCAKLHFFDLLNQTEMQIQ